MADKAKMGVVSGAIKQTFRAEGGALTRGFGVIKGTADDQALIAGAAALTLGVVAETAGAAGLPVSVVLFGPAIGIAGAAITAGSFVKTDAAGKFVPSAGEDTANSGWALSSADADTDEFVIFVQPVKKRS